MSQLELEVEKKKRTGKEPKPRIACSICGKPAIRYVNRKKGTVEYEHRDDPPILEFLYRGHMMKRYRRCYAGRIAKGGLDGIVERLTTGKQQHQIKHIKKEKEAIQHPKQPQQTSLAETRKQLETIILRLKNEETNEAKPFIRVAYLKE